MNFEEKLRKLVIEAMKAQRFEDDQFHSWPAIPGPDGSYEVPE